MAIMGVWEMHKGALGVTRDTLRVPEGCYRGSQGYPRVPEGSPEDAQILPEDT